MIKHYRLFVKLLSDTIIASDKGYGAIIDTDVVFDEVGLPYIPAKRLKGVLRESAEVLSNIFQRADINFDIDVCGIFGKQGRASSEAGANFIIPNLYIDDYGKTRDFFDSLFSDEGADNASRSKFNISKEDVMSFFTNIRMQTAIDSELGKTRKHSLRSMRVLDKNMVFSSSFELDEIYIDQLLYICAATKNIGSKRNRGFGEARVYIKDEKGGEMQLRPFNNF